MPKRGKKKTLLVNRKNSSACLTISGATGGTIFTVDEATADGPPRMDHITSEGVTLAPFAVAVVYYGN